jgi:hypothetical protein
MRLPCSLADVKQPRRCQYLDAVIQVKAEPGGGRFTFPTLNSANNPEPFSPTGISALRLKCPNLRVVTRHNTGVWSKIHDNTPEREPHWDRALP